VCFVCCLINGNRCITFSMHKTTDSINIMLLGHVQNDVTELYCHGSVFDELANGQAGPTHWSLVDAYVSVVT